MAPEGERDPAVPAPPRAPTGRRLPLLWEAGETRIAWLLGGVLLVVVLAALHAAGSVALIVLGSVFAAMLVAPIDGWVRARVPDKLGWLGPVAALLALIAGLTLFLVALGYGATRLLSEAQAFVPNGMMPGAGPEGADAAAAAAAASEEEGAGMMAQARALMDRFGLSLGSLASQAAGYLSGWLTSFLSGAVAALTGVVLVAFLALMMLTEAGPWRDRLARAVPQRHGVVTDAMTVLARDVRQFALVRLVMGIVTAALYALWLWVTGVDLIWTWAILTVILAFVPTIGSIISGVLPSAYALLTRDFGTALLVAAGLLVIEQVIGNWVDPQVAGRRLHLSPLVVLISVLVWGWVLGPAGALIATPITMAIQTFAARIEPLRPLALMLSDRGGWSDLDDSLTREGQARAG